MLGAGQAAHVLERGSHDQAVSNIKLSMLGSVRRAVKLGSAFRLVPLVRVSRSELGFIRGGCCKEDCRVCCGGEGP